MYSSSSHINFHRFVKVFSTFTDRATEKEKIKLAFQCYDVDGDGLVSRDDLSALLKLLVGSNIEDSTLSVIVERAMDSASGSEKNRHLTLGDFERVFGKQIVQNFTVKLLPDSEKPLIHHH